MAIDKPAPPAAPTQPAAPVRGSTAAIPRPSAPVAPVRDYPVNRPVDRVIPLDLTGLYEQVPETGRNSALLLQLNQAGHTLAGWFLPPPSHVYGLSAVTSLGGGRGTWHRPGVFAAVANKTDWSAGWLLWVQATDAQMRDPDPLAMYSLDPTDLLSRAEGTVGAIRFVPPDMGIVGQEVRVMFRIAGKRLSDDASWDRFRRVGRGPRLPHAALEALAPGLRELIIATQVQPSPASNVELMVERLVGRSASAQPATKLERRLASWAATSSSVPTPRRLAREAVVNELLDATGVLDMASRYRSRETALLRARLSGRELQLGQARRSLLGWLRALAGEEADLLDAEQKADPQAALKRKDHASLRVLDALGVSGPGGGQAQDLLYTFDFVEIGAAVGEALADAMVGKPAGQPKTLRERAGQQTSSALAKAVAAAVKKAASRLRLPSGPYVGITPHYGAFILNITCEEVTAKRDSDGMVEYKDGKPVVDEGSRKSRWVSKNAFGLVYVGAGAGVKAALKGGSPASKQPLTKVQILSSVEVQEDDFFYATARTTLLAGPKVKVGNFGSFDSFSSREVDFTLAAERGGMSLATNESAALKLKLMELGDLVPELQGDLKAMVDSWSKKWSEPELELRLADVAGVWGLVVPLDLATGARPSDHQPPPARGGHRTAPAPPPMVQSFFARESALVDTETALASGTTRQDLELGLATFLAYLQNPTAVAEVVGTTSPEQPADANLALSAARARAVRQATIDALGVGLLATLNPQDCHGLGEAPALENGLRDPEALGMSGKAFADAHPEEADQWPMWRRADLYVDGEAVVSLGAE